MHSLLRICPLTLAALTALLAADPAPAVITKLDDKGEATTTFDDAFVVAETVDGVEFLVEDPRTGNKLTMKRGSYTVQYDRTKDIDVLRGEGQEREDAARALAFYQRAVVANRFAWAKEEALLGIARLGLASKQYDQVVTAADQLAKDAPRSLHLDDILFLKGQAQQAKGDEAGAKATFGSLAGLAKDWGDAAATRGSLGLASLLAAEKKFTEAAAQLEPLLARLQPAKQADDVAALVVTIAGYHQSAGKTDAALAVLAKAAFVPSSAAAGVHLRRATILADLPGRLIEAFDHAAIAATMPEAPEAVRAQARGLARSLVEKLQKEPGLNEQQKLEYRQARDNL